MRTKFGISVGLLASIMYLAPVFGGVTVLILIAGYCLVAEEEVFLKKAALKAILVYIGFSFLIKLVGIIPMAFGNLTDWTYLYGIHIFFGMIRNFGQGIVGLLRLLQTLCFLVLAYQAYRLGDIKLPIIDDIINKAFEA